MERKHDEYFPITKDVFIKTLDAIKEYHTKIDNINNVLKDNCEDAILYPPSLESTLINVLEDAFNDETDIIGYFIYELEFGEKWHAGCVTENNKDIKMQTPEELYDYLIGNIF